MRITKKKEELEPNQVEKYSTQKFIQLQQKYYVQTRK